MKRMLLLLTSVILLTGLGCSFTDSRAAKTLQNLRKSLDEVRSTPDDKTFRARPQDASALVGLSESGLSPVSADRT